MVFFPKMVAFFSILGLARMGSMSLAENLTDGFGRWGFGRLGHPQGARHNWPVLAVTDLRCQIPVANFSSKSYLNCEE